MPKDTELTRRRSSCRNMWNTRELRLIREEGGSCETGHVPARILSWHRDNEDPFLHARFPSLRESFAQEMHDIATWAWEVRDYRLRSYVEQSSRAIGRAPMPARMEQYNLRNDPLAWFSQFVSKS